MKVLPMNLRLASGSVTPSALEEQRRGVDVDQRDIVMTAEQRHDLLGLAHTHQAVIDEDAGQLVADRLMDEDRCHGRIDAAGKAAEQIGSASCRERVCQYV